MLYVDLRTPALERIPEDDSQITFDVNEKEKYGTIRMLIQKYVRFFEYKPFGSSLYATVIKVLIKRFPATPSLIFHILYFVFML